MAYTPTVWQDGRAPALSAENLNKIESALEEAHSRLDALPEAPGGGEAGADGREIELRKGGSHIQWRYAGEAGWRDLIPLEDLRGPSGDGSGDMAASTYDPRGIGADAFDRAKHTGTQPIGSVVGLQAALDGKEAAGAAATHVARKDNPHAVTAEQVGADPAGTAAAAVGVHAGATKGAHGIADTAKLVLTDDARLSNARTPTAHSHSWSEVTDKPSTFTPSAHTHATADVTGLSAALAGKETAGAAATAVAAHAAAGNPHPQYAKATALGSFLRVVQHGDDADFPRPPHDGPVEWRGMAVPANAIAGDTRLEVDVAAEYPEAELTVTLLAPQPGSTRTVGVPTLMEAAVDGEEAVTGVEFVVNNELVGAATFDAGRSRWTLSWTPTTAGPITVQVRATSATGVAASDPAPVTLEDPPPAPSDALVQFPDPKVEFILAPQVYAGDGKMDGTSTTTSRVPWPFTDANMETAGRLVTRMYPSTPPEKRDGTGGPNKFVLDTPVLQPDELVDHTITLLNSSGGTLKSGLLVTSNTADTIHFSGYDATGAVRMYLMAGTTEYTQGWAREWHYYYDLGLVAWQCYYRTQDPWWRDQAVRVTRSFARNNTDKPAPRSAAIAGQLLTALYEDETLTGEGPGGRSLLWDQLFTYVEEEGWIWVLRQHKNGVRPLGTREPGYMTLYMAQMAFCLPDTYYATKRNSGANKLSLLDIYDPHEVGDLVTNGAQKRELLKQKLAIAISGYPGSSHGFWGKLQTPDGCWLHGEEEQTVAQGDYAQPFQSALLAEGLIAAHKLLRDDPQFATEVAEVEATIMRLVGYHWFVAYQKPGTPNGAILNYPGENWRGSVYYTHTDTAHTGNRLEGTVTLTPGSTQVTGTGTKFLTEVDHQGLRLFFDEVEPGKVQLTSPTSFVVTGSEGFDFTRYQPNDVLWVSTQNEYYTGSIRLRRIISATQAEVWDLPKLTLCGAPLTVVRPPHLTLPGEWTVDPTAGTLTSTDADASTSLLQVGDRVYVWLETTHETSVVQPDKGDALTTKLISVDFTLEMDTSDEATGHRYFGDTWFEFTSGANAGVVRKASGFTKGASSVNRLNFAGASDKPEMGPLPATPQVGDTLIIHRRTLDRMIVRSVDGPKVFSASSINSKYWWSQGKAQVALYSRTGQPRGAFLVDRVDSDTQLTLQQPWSGPATTTRARQDVWTVRIRSSDTNNIREHRHQSCTISHMFGWAYVHTGDPVWKERGDEIYSGLFGKNVGPGADKYYGLQDYVTPSGNKRGKEWSETMRGSAKYLGYRLGGS